MASRLLHVLSQRPLLTGSGVTLDALVARAAQAGWDQRIVCGLPVDEPLAEIGGVGVDRIDALRFGSGALAFPVPGMSNVMPYPSSRFDRLDAGALEAYRRAWRDHLAAVVRDFAPEVVHVNHIWLVAAMMRELAPDARIVVHSHGTGLRQMTLCPHLAEEVRVGCARADAFLALHEPMRDEIVERLGVERDRVHVVGAGYRDDVFAPAAAGARDRDAIVFAGKYASAKGLPWLLDAVERLAARRRVVLHVAGDGTGDEAEALRARMAALAPAVVMHGMLSQAALAELLRRSAVFVLPSMFEGLPLVLIEALACGCRAVATDLPGVRGQLAPRLAGMLAMVPTPRRVEVDRPLGEDVPAFVAALEAALEGALADGPVAGADLIGRLRPFTWDAVFERVERIWRAA